MSTATLVLMLMAVIGTAAAVDVPKWGRFETSMTNNTAYANKFRDVVLEATFTSPSGKTIPFWGFFDGKGSENITDRADRVNFDALNPPQDYGGELSGNVWKLRFMPDEVGTWTYTWQFSDGSKSGNGSFRCVSAGAFQGPLRVNQHNVRWLQTAEGEDMLLVSPYILPGQSVAYHIDTYGPQVFQKYIDMGANFIVDNGFLPIWTWNTHQTNPDNGPHDRSILAWYQVNGLPQHGNEGGESGDYEDQTFWDTDRMNLFTWKRIEDHADYLADRGVYTFGFQGFHIKRSFRPTPSTFDAAKYEWYVRYSMARLAPYYNMVWNHTWESGSRNDEFEAHLSGDGFDPWNHLYMQVGGTVGFTPYDIDAKDTNTTVASDANPTTPQWTTEGNEQWRLETRDFEAYNSWIHLLRGRMSLICEDHYKLKKEGRGRDETEEIQSARLFTNLGGATLAKALLPFRIVSDEFPLRRMNPHPDVVSGTDLCLASPGEAYLIYKKSTGDFSITLPTGSYTAEWISHIDGSRQAIGTLNGGRSHSFTVSGDFRAMKITSSGSSDSTPPSQVTGLQVTARGDTSVDLAWNAASDAESGISGYQIYRDGSLLTTVSGTNTSVGGLNPQSTYSFTVQAVNGAGLTGAASDAVSATTLAPNAGPTVSLTGISNDQAFPASSPITFTADAADSDGSVVSVTFEVLNGNDQLLLITDSDGSDGWSATWAEPQALSPLEVQATATDDRGASTDSLAISFMVTNTDPVINAATADPNPVTTDSTQLSVSASDVDGDSLTISWTANAPTGANPVIGSGDNPTVTFDMAGAYSFTVTIDDGHGGVDSQTISVTVEQDPRAIDITP